MAFKTAQADAVLDKSLKEFGLGFLAPKLKGINDIGRLSSGLAGRSLLAEFGTTRIRKLKPDAELEKDAVRAFEILGGLKSDFDAKFNELLYRKRPIGAKCPNKLELACFAFKYAMEKGKISYKKNTDLLSDGLLNSAVDCDTSAWLFVQLGKGKGLDLAGTKTPQDHYVAIYRKDGKISSFVETTLLTYGGKPPLEGKEEDMGLAAYAIRSKAGFRKVYGDAKINPEEDETVAVRFYLAYAERRK